MSTLTKARIAPPHQAGTARRSVRSAAALALAAVLLAAPARAGSLDAPRPDRCRAAISTAEAETRTPPGLLFAIGLVETGRADPQTGKLEPWPWSVNVAGTGHMLATQADAIALVRAAQADGVRSIDVGCMQINLQQHPDAFASLEEAFDPRANARYAAGFLQRLHAQAGAQTAAWLDAGAAYHSQTPEFATPYRQRLEAAWLGAGHTSRPLDPAHPVTQIAEAATNRLSAMRFLLQDARADHAALLSKTATGGASRSAINLPRQHLAAAALPGQGGIALR